MSYAATEKSVHDAAPIECYRFIGQSRTYRYTSADTELLLGGELYQPLQVTRTAARAGTHDDDRLSLELTLPFDCPLVRDYAYATSPAKLLAEVFRAHRGADLATDYALIWKGNVASYNVEGRTAKLIIPSLFATALESEAANVYYQQPCNHVLYSPQCGLVRAVWTRTAVVLSVAGRQISVSDDGFDNGRLVAGELVNTSNGERRLILSNIDNTLVINYPFVEITPGTIVELVAGCDHSYEACGVFNNRLRFGGFRSIPPDNPFIGEL